VLGDRVDGRRYLGLMHALMALPPMLMIAVYQTGHLGYAWVVTFGVLMASLQALSDPARQAALSRVARLEAQRAVTIMTILTSGVGLAGFYLGAWLDVLGLDTVLLLQSVVFAAGILATRRLPDLSLPDTDRPRLGDGFRALWGLPRVRNVIGLNFASSLFNAGAYIVAIPYIVTQIYAGDAAFFATVMIVFTAGSIGSNVLLLACMPLRRPGRLFLVMQLTRAAILTVLWLQPATWVFLVALFAWGLNMGITTTLVRTTVQELAPAAVRAQILSMLLLSFLVSSPISAALLGVLITSTSPLTALLPGVAISLILFAVGARSSGLWQYRYDGRPLEMP